MNKMKFEFEESSGDNSIISAFAYTTGNMIEKLINKTSDNIKLENRILEAKILSFYRLIDNEDIRDLYKDFFDIEVDNNNHK